MLKKNYQKGLVVAAVALLADLLSKQAALQLTSIVEVIPNFVNFRLAFNPGVSFSMFANVSSEWMPYVLAGVNILAAVFFAFWMFKEQRLMPVIGLGLMIGGAVGNAVDRFVHGAVVDFLDFYYATWHFPTFNVADSVINIGVVLLLLDGILHMQREKKNDENK